MRYPLRRYHFKLYMPDYVGQMLLDFFTQIKFVDITKHAAEELSKDKRGTIPLPSKDEMFDSRNQLIEIYERLDEKNKPLKIAQKIVVRIGFLNDNYDYVYVLAREGYVVSAWAVDKGDDHRLTGSAHLYYIPVLIKDKVLHKLSEEQRKYNERKKQNSKHPINRFVHKTI